MTTTGPNAGLNDAPAASGNGLICFTNCLLPQEDGSMVEKDLWIDQQRGVILDASRTFYLRKERPDTIIDLGGNVLSPGLIDIQINGAYDFDFSIYDGDDDKYRAGLDLIARRIVETGLTALVPTIITQEKFLYPHLLSLLKPYTPLPTPDHPVGGATLLGWHAEGPFLQGAKRGAHSQPYLLTLPSGWPSIESVYGEQNLLSQEDWDISTGSTVAGVRMVTIAPEVQGAMEVIPELSKRGVVVSIGHSIASSDIATRSVRRGAKLITHLFNAMPQLHHRDPGIIGLLGASPASLVSRHSPTSSVDGVEHFISSATTKSGVQALANSGNNPKVPTFSEAFSGPVSGAGTARGVKTSSAGSEALDEHDTPPQTPLFHAVPSQEASRSDLVVPSADAHFSLGSLANAQEVDEKKAIDSERPFYGMIVDGVHSHPNSVRLAYTSHKDGCILITDAMKILDPNMPDGVYDWRESRRVVKEGVRLYIEGTDTLAGSVVTLDTCVRNFARFTGCSLGEAIKCATYNPAKCLNIQDRKGTLRPGADADLVVLDRQGNVLSTWVGGKKVWKKQ